MARPAYSLDVLLKQLNTLAPNRSKLSDGWIGDAAHADRVSDHNPDVNGIVHARDFTHDPAGGLDCNWLAGMLVHFRDPRIKYLIWNYKIWTPVVGWVAYSGSNPHTKHLHLSVTASRGDEKQLWLLEEDVPLTPKDANTVLMGNTTGTDPVSEKPETHPYAEWFTVMAYRVRDMEERSRKAEEKLDKLLSIVEGLQ